LRKSRFSEIAAVIFVSFLLVFCGSAPPGPPQREEDGGAARDQAIQAQEAATADNNDDDAAPVVSQEDRLLMEAEFKKLIKSERRQDYPSDASFANFREVKLGSMASGILYRSSHPALGDTRSPYAARLAEQARVGSIIDLADNPEEMAFKASVIPWYQSFITQGNSIAAAMETDYDSQYNRAKIREVLRFMLNHKKPFLLHCADGSGRSGFIVMILAALMDASREEILGDYMRSYVNYYGFDTTEDRYRLISYSGEDMIALIRGASGGESSPRRSPVSGLREKAESYLGEKIQLNPGEIAGLRRLLAGQQP
jgi:hypothetical protein